MTTISESATLDSLKKGWSDPPIPGVERLFMTDLEHELRMETKALTDDGDPLAGYRLVAFDRDGGSSWFNAALGKHLYRDPDGSVVDPRSLRSVNYAKDMVDTKRYIEGEER